ncbi:MAG: AI-2E family transporter [Gammaproteobacteria bacterium]|nr:AI-2E family transporter [Gammaproteobacteria bacterium]
MNRNWIIGGIAATVGVLLLYRLSGILSPFIAALLIAYIFAPAMARAERNGIPRGLAVALLFLIIGIVVVVALLVLVPALIQQVTSFANRLPGLTQALQQWLPMELPSLDKLQAVLGENWREIGSVLMPAAKTMLQHSLSVVDALLTLTITPVVAFYLLRDWERIITGLRNALPRAIEPKASTLTRESDQALGAFLHGQLLVMAALAVLYTAGLRLVGLDQALLIGVLSGTVSFVPYLGLIVGLLLAVVSALLQFPDWIHLLSVVAVFGIVQTLESTLLTPWLVGDRIGLHPVTVIFAVLAGGQLFGFMGILLALPVAAVLGVLTRHAWRAYLSSRIYQGDHPA